MSSEIEIIRSNKAVAEIWLNRPEIRNALNPPLIRALREAFQQLTQESDLRLVILSGRGKVFCAGADLQWMQKAADFSWDENYAGACEMAEMLYEMYRFPLPIVGRIHGDCYAGGMGLAALCDVLLVADQVQFCLSEARIGLLPATISPYVVSALGLQACRRYMVSAERFSAQRAFELGFAHEVMPLDQLDTKLLEIQKTILQNGPNALKLCKRLVQDIANLPLHELQVREDTAKRIADARASSEGREGLASFLEKRSPNWIA
ncbi:MAG: enoyl-CoA hydratase/isomerase family protein [Gammaproteobacteria bacterium]|nr:enoyl-CoA hydratase/isomerase family protein [Gammaproteobacteria bacterium]